jgi:hypothetical protein
VAIHIFFDFSMQFMLEKSLEYIDRHVAFAPRDDETWDKLCFFKTLENEG